MSSSLAEIRKRFPDEDGGRASKCVAATIGSGRQAVTQGSASGGQNLPKPNKDRKNDARQPSYNLRRYLASQNPYESLALGLSSTRKSSNQKGTEKE
ncbi:hypothetical protein AC578_10144 [Pseudocercospora eumusae]|uniref:Uncharacterized protein n=1 Tax=Pseudocercospora eumusae TaxID=321146 RepID=A0A139HZ45_9PEZI|nr:hypothetical protein AC578_10144 [Pseudocercospora eumusae]